MNKKYILALVVVLIAGITVIGQNAFAAPPSLPTMVIEQAKTQLYQFVDTPYSVTYPRNSGEVYVNLEPSNYIISADGYRQVCVEVLGTATTTSFDLIMGKISGATLSDRVADDQPADAKIHCYSINGPQVSLLLNGLPGTTDNVQLWMHLRS